jgi:hypothetical protein
VIRIALATSALAIGFAATDTVYAQQQPDPYPWCAEYSGGGLDGAKNCYFRTLEQCRAAVSGVGGFCTPNPFYTGPGPLPSPRGERPLPVPRIFQW